MNNSLRNLSESYLAIRDELFDTMDEETGEVSPEIMQRLCEVEDSFKDKVQNVALVFLDFADRREAIKREIERLQSLLKRAERVRRGCASICPKQCLRWATNELTARW